MPKAHLFDDAGPDGGLCYATVPKNVLTIAASHTKSHPK